MRRLLFLAIALIATACGANTSPSPTAPGPAALTVVVRPNPLGVGESGVAATYYFNPPSSNGVDVSTATIWSSIDPSIASISAGGTVSALTSGQTFIQGQYQSIAAEFSLRVITGQDIDKLFFAFDAGQGQLQMAVGRTVALTARIIVGVVQSDVLPGTRLTWASSQQGVVAVATDGTVTAIAPGIADITAVFLGRVTTVRITVVPAG